VTSRAVEDYSKLGRCPGCEQCGGGSKVSKAFATWQRLLNLPLKPRSTRQTKVERARFAAQKDRRLKKLARDEECSQYVKVNPL